MFLKYILFSLFVSSVFSVNIIGRQYPFGKDIPIKISDVVKREASDSFDGLIDTTEQPKEVSTEIPTPPPEEAPKEVPVFNEEPKEEGIAKEEEPKAVSSEETPVSSEEPTEESLKKEDLNIKKEGERIEREDEDEKVSSERPKEAEDMTPSNSSPSSPPVIPSSTPGYSRPPFTPPRPTPRPALPSAPSPPEAAPPSRPSFVPIQPSGFPSTTYPNYWENPNWGNWGRFIPANIPTWANTVPSFAFPGPSVPTLTAVASIPSISSYSPNNIPPVRYSPFAMNPSSQVPTFSFMVPRNPYPSGGRGFQYPGTRPTYSGFQPSYQPRYLPPGGGPTQGLFPGVGGYYPGVEESRPSGGFYPGAGHSPRIYPEAGHSPRVYPGAEEQPSRPQPQPGADPNRPYGPLGPEMNEPDATMIDPNLMHKNDPQG